MLFSVGRGLCFCCFVCAVSFSFFFNHTATTEIYTLSLHDALPICQAWKGDRSVCSLSMTTRQLCRPSAWSCHWSRTTQLPRGDRKSTRLNSSHRCISYAVFCLKKKKKLM